MLWVILMEVKVSQVACFQITSGWICYTISVDISFIVFVTRFLSKGLQRNYPFSTQIQNYISRCRILIKIRMPDFVILKWRPFKYKVKRWKICPFLGLFFSEIKNADILNFWWIKYFGNDYSFLKKKKACLGLLLLRLRFVKLENRTESRLLIANWYIGHGSGQLPPANSL